MRSQFFIVMYIRKSFLYSKQQKFGYMANINNEISNDSGICLDMSKIIQNVLYSFVCENVIGYNFSASFINGPDP